MEFEWDENKSQQTYRDRGFDFEFATRAFSDPTAFREPDLRFPYGEARIIHYGEIPGRLLLSSTQSGKESSVSSLPEEQTLVRFRRTSSGELMRQTTEGCWNAAVEQVDWSKIDATSDAEIERQEIADLVDVALQRQVGGLVALAERLHVSPSSVRRWRQARVMPSLVHRQRLHHLLKAL